MLGVVRMVLLMKLLVKLLRELLVKLLMKLLRVATTVTAGDAHLRGTLRSCVIKYSMLVQVFRWLVACVPCRPGELFGSERVLTVAGRPLSLSSQSVPTLAECLFR